MAVLDAATVETLCRHWNDGWNRADLTTIMAPFADDVVFASPGISMLTGDPERSTIEGRAALRDYIAEALRLTPGVRYTTLATHVGTASIVLVYECGVPGGPQKHGADLMRVDATGRVVEWRCHY